MYQNWEGELGVFEIMWRNFVDDTWEKFNSEVRKDKKLYLMGFNMAKIIIGDMGVYGNPWNIVAILDNDTSKHGIVEIGNEKYSVIPPEKLIGQDTDTVLVLICGTYVGEMAEQLENLGIKNYYSQLFMTYDKALKHHLLAQVDHRAVEQVKKLMFDDRSRKTLDSIVTKRENGFIDYTDVMIRGSDYFIEEFWDPIIGGVYVDGGGYDGDTIKEIYEWTKGRFKKIFTFEPQQNLANKIESDLWHYNNKVQLIRKGLWFCNTELCFKEGNETVSGKVNENGDSIIETTSLDDVVEDEHIDFIKMDIEGAEVEALRGAIKTIQRDMPKLAICIYHKPDDLWRIPLMIHEMVPSYKMYIRHCGITRYGTILYAKCE